MQEQSIYKSIVENVYPELSSVKETVKPIKFLNKGDIFIFCDDLVTNDDMDLNANDDYNALGYNTNINPFICVSAEILHEEDELENLQEWENRKDTLVEELDDEFPVKMVNLVTGNLNMYSMDEIGEVLVAVIRKAE